MRKTESHEPKTAPLSQYEVAGNKDLFALTVKLDFENTQECQLVFCHHLLLLEIYGT